MVTSLTFDLRYLFYVKITIFSFVKHIESFGYYTRPNTIPFLDMSQKTLISSLSMARFCFFVFINCMWMITMILTTPATARFQPSSWSTAHATFYGDETASATMGGACGYGDLRKTGYGTDTAALSSKLFNNGYACGTCYQIKCVQSPHCYKGYPFTTVTATNLCPPNWSEDSNAGGWCNPPRTHFDMSKPAFMKIAEWKAGIVPVMYRRVPCVKKGGLRFSFQGNGYWLLVYVMNVRGGGDIASMWVKGSKTKWISMSHNWGASYQAFSSLGGQTLSFKLTSYTTKETIIVWNVAPSNWHVGLTYQGAANFS